MLIEFQGRALVPASRYIAGYWFVQMLILPDTDFD
jgi:hypothetical protein